jgi:MinD-like ATPase involved in chromosome partitioning or flagellar assembly
MSTYPDYDDFEDYELDLNHRPRMGGAGRVAAVCRIIGFTGAKGGGGKSPYTFAFCVRGAERGLAMLAVSGDPQPDTIRGLTGSHHPRPGDFIAWGQDCAAVWSMGRDLERVRGANFAGIAVDSRPEMDTAAGVDRLTVIINNITSARNGVSLIENASDRNTRMDVVLSGLDEDHAHLDPRKAKYEQMEIEEIVADLQERGALIDKVYRVPFSMRIKRSVMDQRVAWAPPGAADQGAVAMRDAIDDIIDRHIVGRR